MSSALDTAEIPTDAEHRGESPLERSSWRSRLTWWAIVAASAAVAGGVAFLVAARGDAPLSVRTSIVGYPTFANFNPATYTTRYWAIIAVFPAVLIGLAGLARLAFRVGPSKDPASLAWLSTGPAVPVRLADLCGPARLALVSSVVGLELAMVLPGGPWVVGVIVAAAGGVGFLSGVLLDRLHAVGARYVPSRARVTVALAVVAAAGVWSFGRATRVIIESSGATIGYHWLPGWAAVALGAAAGVMLWLVGRRRGWDQAEGAAAWLVAMPIVIFIMVLRLREAIQGFDMFHSGEGLGAADLVIDRGYLPWREILFIHGLTADVLNPAVGLQILENSAWGSIAGRAFVAALTWVGLYLLLRCLFRGRNVVAAAVVLGAIAIAQIPKIAPLALVADRFVLQGFVFAVFGAYIARRTWPWGLAAGFMIAVQAILTPESLFAAVACGLVLITYDVTHNDRSWCRNRFPVTLRVLAGVGIAGAGFLLYLAATGSVGAYLVYFKTFAPEHTLTGGIPVQWQGGVFDYAVFVLPAVILLGVLYCGWQVLRRRNLRDEEWLAAAILLFAGAYYAKFLGRADGHLWMSWSMAVPLMAYMAVRLADAIGVAAGRGLTRWSATWRRDPQFSRGLRFGALALVLMVLVGSQWGALQERALTTKARLTSSVAEPALNPRFGFGTPPPQIASAAEVLDSVRGPETTVFDFTNAPALFTYFLGEPSTTRFFHVSMAIRFNTQKMLIDELAANPPDVIAYSGVHGLYAWDGFVQPDGTRMVIENPVRHYAVSNWIMRNYRPFTEADGVTYLIRNGLTAQRAPIGTPVNPATLGVGPCDWGYSPEFLSAAGPSRKTAKLTPMNGATFAAPSDGTPAEYDTLILQPATAWNGGVVTLLEGAGNAEPIRFLTERGSTAPLRVFVGGCPKWHAATGTIAFSGAGASAIGAVTLEATLPDRAPR